MKDETPLNVSNDSSQRLGVYIVIAILISVTIISTLSFSQSKESIFGLYAMALNVIAFVAFFMIRKQNTSLSGKRHLFSMDNPLMALVITTAANLLWWYLFTHFL